VNDEQLILDGLQLTIQQAIALAKIGPLKTDSKVVSDRTLKRVLQYVASYQSRSVWKSVKDIAIVLSMDDGTVRRAFRALVDARMIEEQTARKPYTRSLILAEVIERIPSSDNVKQHAGNGDEDIQPMLAQLSASCGQLEKNGPHHAGTTARINRAVRPAHRIEIRETSSSVSEQLDGVTKVVFDLWTDARAAMETSGVKRIDDTIAKAITKGITPEELIEAAYVADADPDLLPGASVYWVDKGDWPREGVQSAEWWRAKRSRETVARQSADETRMRERHRRDVCREWAKSTTPRVEANIQAEVDRRMNLLKSECCSTRR